MNTDKEKATWAASILTAYAEEKPLEILRCNNYETLHENVPEITIRYWIDRSLYSGTILIRVKEC